MSGVFSLCLLPNPSFAPPAHAQELRLEEIRRIGTLDGPLAFSHVGQVVLGEGGLMYVTQPQENAVRIIDSNGRQIARFGRTGAGPGEFRLLAGIGFSKGMIWVSDGIIPRLTIFTPRGDFVRTVPLAFTEFPAGVRAGPVTSVFENGSMLVLPRMGGAITQTGASVPVIRIHPDGSYAGTLHSLRMENLTVRIDLPNNRMVQFTNPLGAPPLHAPAPSGNYHAGIGSLRAGFDREPVLLVAWPDSAHQLEIPIPAYAAASFSEASLRAMHERVRDGLVQAGFPEAEAWRLAVESVQPPQHGFIRHLVAGEDGLVWLRPAGDATARVEWMVFDTRTRTFRRAALPGNVTVHQSRDGLVVGVEVGEYDVQRVVVYRLTGR